MIIRKLFEVESAHVVRNCTTERCSKSLHGHSYKVELLFEGWTLDHGGMIVDFGIMKREIKDLVDSFDHTYVMWSRESAEFKDFIKSHSDRWIEMSVSPSAENLSLIICWLVSDILERTKFVNGEQGVSLSSVIVHETRTGYAQCFYGDVLLMLKNPEVRFSEAVKNDWKNPMMLSAAEISTPQVTHQILEEGR